MTERVAMGGLAPLLVGFLMALAAVAGLRKIQCRHEIAGLILRLAGKPWVLAKTVIVIPFYLLVIYFAVFFRIARFAPKTGSAQGSAEQQDHGPELSIAKVDGMTEGHSKIRVAAGHYRPFAAAASSREPT